MSITLIDWLYTDDSVITSGQSNINMSNNFEKQGALIIFPRMLDRWNVASLIVSKWEDYKVVIVTDYPNEFMETIYDNDLSGTKQIQWTDLELIPFPLIKYSDLDSINRALKNTEIDIILFDDARMLATISPALQFNDFSSQTHSIIQPKILVLSTWGDTLQQLDIVTSKLPGLRLLVLDIINDIANVEWKTARVSLSPRQLKYYDQVRIREIKDISEHSISYPITRMLTLYAYPDKIMMDTLVHKSICE
jgi:hypothetical protein